MSDPSLPCGPSVLHRTWSDERELETFLAELRKWVRRKGMPEAESDEAIDDVRLEAYDRKKHPVQPTFAYAFGIARKRLLRWLRRKRIRLRHHDSAIQSNGWREAVAPDASIEDAEERAHLRARVAALREPFRSVVRARYFDGQSVAEIARRRRRSFKTIYTQLDRALACLRRASP